MTRVSQMRPLPDYRLWVLFDDGREGEYAVGAERRGGVFKAVGDPAIFGAVAVKTDSGCME